MLYCIFGQLVHNAAALVLMEHLTGIVDVITGVAGQDYLLVLRHVIRAHTVCSGNRFPDCGKQRDIAPVVLFVGSAACGYKV